MLDNSIFKVQIQCTTYNHESFITDAMNGFVMQKTVFPFVATIIDDASTDKTPETIIKYLTEFFVLDNPKVTHIEEREDGQFYVAQHKENLNCVFAVLLLRENHHQQKKSKAVYYQEWSHSKYKAFCEGDDYWTDPCKLQKQVDYLESHPDCTLTVHSADWEIDSIKYPYGCQELTPKDYSVEDVIRCGGLFFSTASFVFRAELEKDRPEWRQKAGVGDFPLQILAGLRGRVHYLPDKMCVYRYLHQGSWSFNQKSKDANVAFQKNKIEWMTMLDESTGFKYQKAIYDQLFQHFVSLFSQHEIGLWEYAQAVHKSGQKRYGRLIKDFLRIKLSPIYQFLNRFNKKKN